LAEDPISNSFPDLVCQVRVCLLDKHGEEKLVVREEGSSVSLGVYSAVIQSCSLFFFFFFWMETSFALKPSQSLLSELRCG